MMALPLLLALLAPADAPPAAGGASVVVWEVRARGGLSEDSATLLTEAVTVSVRRSGRFGRVTSFADVRRTVEVGAVQQALDESAEAVSAAEIAGALGAQQLVIGSVGHVGDVTVLNLRLVDCATGTPVRAVSRQFPAGDDGELLLAMDGAVAELLTDPAEPRAAPPTRSADEQASRAARTVAASPTETLRLPRPPLPRLPTPLLPGAVGALAALTVALTTVAALMPVHVVIMGTIPAISLLVLVLLWVVAVPGVVLTALTLLGLCALAPVLAVWPRRSPAHVAMGLAVGALGWAVFTLGGLGAAYVTVGVAVLAGGRAPRGTVANAAGSMILTGAACAALAALAAPLVAGLAVTASPLLFRDPSPDAPPASQNPERTP